MCRLTDDHHHHNQNHSHPVHDALAPLLLMLAHENNKHNSRSLDRNLRLYISDLVVKIFLFVITRRW